VLSASAVWLETMIRKLEQIRQCVTEGNFGVWPAARDALRLEGLTVIDLEAAILSGDLTARCGKDGAGCRYVVTGETTSGDKIRVLCRFSAPRRLVVLALNGQGSAHSRKYVRW